MASGFEMTLMEAARALDVELVGADHSFTGVSTDSRTINKGELFVALVGPSFDGHEYIKAARERGAVAVMVSKRVDGTIPQLIVEDTRIGLGQLASFWRSKFDIPVIGITGSNGKTTVKEMVSQILSGCGEVMATQGNFNNDIGVPLTLFRLRKEHDYAVIEMGANHAGEIAYLASLAKPRVGLVNNAGGAHLEGFGSLEGVANAKGEMYQALKAGDVAVINGDDRFVSKWEQMAAQSEIVHFAINNSAEYSAEILQGNEFKLITPQGEIEIRLPLLGRHNVMNAVAASAMAMSVGISLQDIKRGLEGMKPVPGRLESKQGLKGGLVIDDTYNANPSSLSAGLTVLSTAGGAKKYLLLGDMGELGDDAAEMHAQAGKEAKQIGIDHLYATGELARRAVDAFGDGAFYFDKQNELIEAVKPLMDEQSVVLVKGSRKMKMEQVVASLTEGAAN